MKKLCSLLACVLIGTSVWGADVKNLSLEMCETSALDFSPAVKAAQAQAAAAQAAYEGTRGNLYPSLYLDAAGSWTSEVPQLQVGPQTFEFGSEWGYSVGPTLEYVLFDNGARSSASHSAQAAYQSKLAEYNLARKQLLLQVRQAYFSVQRDLENLFLLSEQLKVTRKQLADVRSAYKAGAKSRRDVLLAEKQSLRTAVDASSARAQLAGDLRDLFKLTGTDYGIDPHYPLDWRVREKLDGETSAVIRADDPAKTVQRFAPFAQLTFDEDTPRLAAFDGLIQSYEYAARGYAAALWPRVGLSAGAYAQYPNGPIQEDVFLGKAGLSLRFPLFEGKKNRSQARSQEQAAEAAREQKRDTQEALKALFLSAKDSLGALDIETRLANQLADKADQSARLTYQAYNAGAVTFSEVDDANLSALQSRIMLNELNIRRLNGLAVLDSLGK